MAYQLQSRLLKADGEILLGAALQLELILQRYRVVRHGFVKTPRDYRAAGFPATETIFVSATFNVRMDKKELSPRWNPGNLSAPMQQVNLGIVGGGTVGGGVFQAIQRNGALVSSRLGVGLHTAKMAVRDVTKKRAVEIPKSLL